jgi:hypothetical protein
MIDKIIKYNESLPRNWVEDYEHENGNYLNFCGQCSRRFFGHKRRVICKECSEMFQDALGKPC